MLKRRMKPRSKDALENTTIKLLSTEQWTANRSVRQYLHQRKWLCLIDGLVCHVPSTGSHPQIHKVLRIQLRQDTLRRLHDESGYFVSDKTAFFSVLSILVPGCLDNVAAYIQSCYMCQWRKQPHVLVNLFLLTGLWKHWPWTSLVHSRQHPEYLLVWCDYFTKWM